MCETYWHRCPLHRVRHCGKSVTGRVLKTKRQTRAGASNPEKVKTVRLVGPDSHEWLTAQDAARAKRKRHAVDDWDRIPSIVLGTTSYDSIKPSFLSLLLRRKFLRLNSEMHAERGPST